MKLSAAKAEQPQFLSGWKEIANYLGKGVRTVQRYERKMGLPVRRPAGKAAGSVIATKAELDAWVSASPIREIFQLRDPRPDYASQTHDLKTRLSEMTQLREQMFALRHEIRESVALLHNSIGELQQTLTPKPLRISALYSESESSLLEAVFAPIRYRKAS